MKHLVLVGATCILWQMAPLARAQESPAEIARKLGSGKFADRELAAKKLEDLGWPAIPILEKLLFQADLETKRRAHALIERIENRMLTEEMIQPSLVRLRLPKTTFLEAAPEGERHFGLTFGSIASLSERSVEEFATNDTYWTAWRKFCNAFSLSDESTSTPIGKFASAAESNAGLNSRLPSPADWIIRRVYLADAKKHRGFHASDERKSIRVRARLETMDSNIEKNIPWAIVGIEVRPEPRLNLASAPRVEVTKVIAADGKEIPLDMPHLANDVQAQGLLQFKAIRMRIPRQSIKDIHGIVRFEAVVRPPLIEISNVARAVGKQFRANDGPTLTILEVTKVDDGQLMVRFRLDDVKSLTPKTLDEAAIRVRPGLIVFRGPMDIAIERLDLKAANGQKARYLRAPYDKTDDGKGYEAAAYFALANSKTGNLILVLSKAPRTITVEMPFAVRDLGPPGSEEK